VNYELYMFTGPNFVTGNGPLTNRLSTGWIVAGGGRSLFFNRDASAAWVVDLGLTYQYNRGNQSDPVDLFIRQPATTNATTGQRTLQPDILTNVVIRGYHRTAFNIAVGRDWFCWGPGAPGAETGWNLRFGTDLGGRWGTAHVDLVPTNPAGGISNDYARRQGVFHGVYFSLHTNVEVPMGGWIWFGGLRAQYGYDWGNIVMPLNGDIANVNLLLTTGWRF
jgi:hypothetical protein